MAYATPADLILRVRPETIADLVSDGPVRVTEDELETNDRLLAALDSASGEMDAALRVGNRYTTAALAALTGNSLAYRKQICGELAWAILLRRNGSPGEAESASKKAEAALESLRKGVNIFDLAENAEAGLPESAGPSVQQIINANGIRERTRHYYAETHTRLPLDRR